MNTLHASYGARVQRPVLVQVRHAGETQRFVSRRHNVSVEKVGVWTFWRGTLHGYPVVVFKTLKGVSNSAAATTIAADRYHPSAIVNQRAAGGHDPGLLAGVESWRA